ncbi:MAG: ABC transporter substrate-binding protein, partial [Candidatus Methylomirabilia bacterium]
GYIEGKNIASEHRFAAGRDERLPELAAELARLKVDVIVTEGTPATRAAKQATETIPIVMVIEGDPVRADLVASLARPGGNITGVTAHVLELSGKRLQLLKEALPGLSRVAVLWNPANPDKVVEWRETEAAARVFGIELLSLQVRSADELEPALDGAIMADALIVLGDSLTMSNAILIARLATTRRLPSMYSHAFVRPGFHPGLMSYGPSRIDLFERVAAYVDKILKGANPADLPVERPTRYEFTVNLKTAKALGLTIPASLLFQADRVIE